MNLADFHKTGLFRELINFGTDRETVISILQEVGFQPSQIPRDIPGDTLGNWTRFWLDVCSNIESGALQQGKDFRSLVFAVNRFYPGNELFKQHTNGIASVMAPGKSAVSNSKARLAGSKYCFVSYSRTDSQAVTDLLRQLEASNIDTWFDKKDMPASGIVADVLQQKISESAAVVVCFGREPIDGWQKSELDLAWVEHVDHRKPLLLVCLYPDVDINKIPRNVHTMNILWLPADLSKLIEGLTGVVKK